MKKTTITKVWIAGLIVLVAGLIVGGVSLGLMFAYGGNFVPAASGSGRDFQPSLDGVFWTTVGFMIVGFTAAAAGGVIQLTSWVGAVLNTYQLQDRTWFVALLACGVLGLGFPLIGFAAMVAYIVAGPDSTVAQPYMPVPEPRPQEMAPTS